MEEGRKDDGSSSSYEDAIDKVGIGWSQYTLLLMCGWANAADAIEMLALSFVIATRADCDLDLTEARKGWVTAAMFAGMMIGGWLWGSLADVYGRRIMLMLALGVNAVFALLSATSISFVMFCLFRFISGLGVGGSIPILFTFFCEFLPSKKRGAFLSLVAAFWMVGSIIAAGLAWLILQPNECSVAASVPFHDRCITIESTECGRVSFGDSQYLPSWRLYIVCGAIPCIVTLVSLFWAPESPKWLASKGRLHEAEKTLMNMYRRNKRVTGCQLLCCQHRRDAYMNLINSDIKERNDIEPDDLTESPFHLAPSPTQSLVEDPDIDSNQTSAQFWPRLWKNIVNVLKASASVFKRPFRRTSFVLAVVWFLLSFGFYGMTLWLPDYYKHGGIPSDVSIYPISFIVAAANLPGNIFALLSIEYLGRRVTLLISMMASAASIFSILKISTTTGTTAFSAVFSGISVAGWNALGILSAELYPTSKRGAAYGVLTAIGRIGAIAGNLVFGQLSASNPTLPLVMTGTALAIGSISCLLLPETKNRQIN